MSNIDPSLLAEIFRYDESGEVYWRERKPSHFDSSIAACRQFNKLFRGKRALATTDTHGYCQGRIAGKLHLAHRVIWALHYGRWPEGQIDHINGDRTDNRIENLREVDATGNARNAKLRRDNTSGVTGVSYRNDSGCWIVQIATDSGRKEIGRFSTKEAASLARKRAEAQYGYHANHGRTAA